MQEGFVEGYAVTRPIKATYVAGEGVTGVRKRIRAWRQRHGYEGTLDLLIVPNMPRLSQKDAVDALIATIKTRMRSCDLVVFDTLGRAAAGLNISAAPDVQLIVEAAEYIMRSLDCGVTFIHHTGKDRERGALGSEMVIANADLVERIDLVGQSYGHRVIKSACVKLKDSELRPDILFKGTTEELGRDYRGRIIDSLVLTRLDATPEARQFGGAAAGVPGQQYKCPCLRLQPR